MELNHLRYFFEVAKAGSFTAAAKNLRVSQPSLSKTVALLEDREGVKLLERSKKGVSLTSLGLEVYEGCEKIFNTLQEVQNTCQRTKEVCEGPLNFGSSDHIANYLLPKKINKMKEMHPKILPSIFVGAPNEIIHAILKKELEFGLFITKVENVNLVYQPIIPVQLAAVYQSKSKSYKSSYVGSIKHDYKVNPAKEILDLIKVKGENTFETNSQEMQKKLCLEGAGLAILVRFMVEEEIKKGLLEEIPIPKQKAMQINVVRRKNHTFTLGAKKFLELLAGA